MTLKAVVACRPAAWHGRAMAFRPALWALLILTTRALAADPVAYDVTIRPSGDAGIDAALAASSSLASLRTTAAVGGLALIARAQRDEGKFRDAMGGLGHYAGVVRTTIAGRPLDDPGLPDALDAAPATPPVPVVVAVDPGPTYTLGAIKVAPGVPAEAQAALGLRTGDPALAASVLAAHDKLLGALRDEGFALANVPAPVATLHDDARAVDVTFPVIPGARVNLGPVAINGLGRMQEDYVRRLLPITQGERYAPDKIAKTRNALLGTGVFGSVQVQTTTAVDARGQLPVRIDLTERPLHAVDAGLSYSTDLGVGANLSWTHRDLFGQAERLTVTALFTGGGSAQRNPGYGLNAVFEKPNFERLDQTLTASAGAVKESLDAYDRTAVTGAVGITRKIDPEWTAGVGVAAEQSRIKQEGLARSYTLLSVPLSAKYDSTTDLLDPKSGVRAALLVTPTESLGTRSATFVAGQISASTYLDVSSLWGQDGRTIVAVRGVLGEIGGAGQFDLPPDRRFYAGGSTTVRGYKYQAIGPLFADRRPQGGIALAAGTLELRQRVLDSFGFVAFADAGEVSAGGSPFGGTLRTGAGVGARYYTAIGPVRLDVAVPLQRVPGNDSFELYIGLGHAF